MPSVDWNADLWNDNYAWPNSGEEWSIKWGGSEAQWYGSLYPRLHRFLPAATILEIAPGFGRWTNYLISQCDTYIGIDLSEKCSSACRERFSGFPKANFFKNDGLSLNDAAKASIDFVFSFDSLVHAEKDVFESYIPSIISKLSRNGVAFIHHSNLADIDLGRHPSHGRGKSVSASVIRDLIKVAGGKLLMQEVISWVDTVTIDCLTLFTTSSSKYVANDGAAIVNRAFMQEAALIGEFQSLYSKIL